MGQDDREDSEAEGRSVERKSRNPLENGKIRFEERGRPVFDALKTTDEECRKNGEEKE
jgi:hypothetical protein